MQSARRYFAPFLVLFALACGDEPVVPTPASLSSEAGGGLAATSGPTNIVYLTTNDPTPGQNAIMAFRRDATCALTLLGRFSMQGSGVGNPNFRLGTLDAEQSIAISTERNLLFALNQGSDQIAVFEIQPDGSLELQNGSPFPSGGIQPASIAVQGKFVYVAHKNEDPGEAPSSEGPSYTTLRINPQGKLHHGGGATFRVPQGSSPTQMLVSNDGNFVFSTDLLVDFPRNFYPVDGFPAGPGAGGGGTLRSFVIAQHGRLEPNSTVRLPGPDKNFPDPLGMLSGSQHISGTTNGALGLDDHPTANILYVGFPFRFQLAVYEWDRATGRLTFRNVVGNSGQMISSVRVSPDGRFLYTVNKLDSSISVYDLSDPHNPVEIIFRDLLLAPGAGQGGLPMQQALSPDGGCLYVLEQRISDAFGDASANAVHVFQTIGGFTELPPINLGALGVPRMARPQGIIAF